MSAAHRYKLVVAYDGTAYAGWQVQPNGLAVQAVLERTVAQLTGETPKAHGSGRTDQGVHARGQVAHLDLARDWQPAALHRALNAVLPADVRILQVGRVPETFHARRSATGKEYRYFIWNGPILLPDRRLYCAHVRKPLDVVLMREAAALLVGRHDFAAFAANPNREIESTTRRVNRLAVLKSGYAVTVVARGEGFLYRMVRSLAGFLIRVGEGAEPPARAREILASRVRTARVPTAPAQGLFLWRVWY